MSEAKVLLAMLKSYVGSFKIFGFENLVAILCVNVCLKVFFIIKKKKKKKRIQH